MIILNITLKKTEGGNLQDLFMSAPFWTFVGAAAGPLLLGIGWGVRRIITKKDEGIKKFNSQMDQLRQETNVLNERFIERTEEVMSLRAERMYTNKLLSNCEQEVARLRHAIDKLNPERPYLSDERVEDKN